VYEPPIGSNFFTKSNAIRNQSQAIPAAIPITPDRTPESAWGVPPNCVPPYGYPSPVPPYGYPPVHPPAYPPIPPFYNYWGQPSVSQTPFIPTTPNHAPSSLAKEFMSSPVPEIIEDQTMTIDDFCATYNLSSQDKGALVRLGFNVGDKLGSISVEDRKEAGIKPLEWQRIYKAYKAWKKETK
jgi:hypothetical protein